MAKTGNGKRGPIKTGLGGSKNLDGLRGVGGGMSTSRARAGVGKSVVKKLRQTGAISKAPSKGDAVKAAKDELKTISGQLDKLGRVNTYKNPAVTKQYSDISKRITHIQKMMKKWS